MYVVKRFSIYGTNELITDFESGCEMGRFNTYEDAARFVAQKEKSKKRERVDGGILEIHYGGYKYSIYEEYQDERGKIRLRHLKSFY